MVAHGGARNRSGRQIDPKSARSDRRGIVLTALPAEGYAGEVPDYPLPEMLVLRWIIQADSKFQVTDEKATAAFRAQELALWRKIWRFPQAAAWAQVGNRWRWPQIAMWTRIYVVCSGAEATSGDKGSLHRFADQIGLTPAGLKENGWAVAVDELAERSRDVEPDMEADDPRDRVPVTAPDAAGS